MKIFSMLLAIFGVAGVLAAENGPRWWSTSTTAIYQNVPSDNYGPANLAQLKNVARKAKQYFDQSLVAQGGSGPAITALVLSFEPRSSQNYTITQVAGFRSKNLALVNVGQAKAVAKLYYDRLLAVGYNTKNSLVRNGFAASWAFNYPWNPGTSVAENYKPLNLGQLKLIFSFAFDVDQNGLDDNWEILYFGSTGQVATGNPDGDNFTNLQESDLWSNPLMWTDSVNLDSNGDGISDADSQAVGLNPYELDNDDDGVINAKEYAQGTNPFWADSDGDGLVDGLDSSPGSGDAIAPFIYLSSPSNVTLVP